ncbi:MAG: T9SS type A sorting domain-containing protein [Flavobacterium sp.]|nr:T9SS type A sorting domain-containing protein [Flavobacterium sp.]
MKTKLFLFFAVLMMSFGANAQINSVALVGAAVGGWPTGEVGEIDVNQLTQVDAENWIIENIAIAVGPCKLRANNAWGGAGFEWAGAFPTAAGTSSGDISVPVAGTYTVRLNTTTGVYNFAGGTPLPTVKLVGAATGTAEGITLAVSAENTFRATNVTLLDGAGQFSIDDQLFGETTFPTGTLTGASDNIPVVAGFYSSVTINIASGEYSFVLIPPVSIVGDGVGGWPLGTPGEIDANQLTSTDAINYSLDKLACIVGPAKFRQDNAWTINWGNPAFPSGTATQGGDNIAITAAGTYDVRFNRVSGDYSFSIPTIALVGSATPTGWPTGAPGEIDAAALTTLDGVTYFLSSVDLTAAECKFRTNNAWDVNFGAADFPAGVGTQGGANIVVPTASTYSVSLNRVTGEYVFTDLLSATSFNKNTFKVYPNPTNRSWNFVSTSDKNITAIQIIDMLGKTVMTINPAATSANVDASNITSGLYFAKVTTTSGTETVKLMKN